MSCGEVSGLLLVISWIFKKCYRNTEWFYSGYSTQLHNVLASERNLRQVCPIDGKKTGGGGDGESVVYCVK